MKQNKKQKIIFGVFIIISFCLAAVLVALASQSGGDYITQLVRAEQHEHYQKMRDNIVELSATYDDLQEYLDLMQQRRLTVEEKNDASEILRHLEEISLNISRRAIFYYEDTTAHLFFSPKEGILQYFDEVRNTPLYIERCVRFVETGLQIPHPTKSQKKSMQDNCTALFEEIERLE